MHGLGQTGAGWTEHTNSAGDNYFQRSQRHVVTYTNVRVPSIEQSPIIDPSPAPFHIKKGISRYRVKGRLQTELGRQVSGCLCLLRLALGRTILTRLQVHVGA